MVEREPVVDPVLLLLGKIREQLDQVMDLVRTERSELDRQKGLADGTPQQ